MMRYIGPLGLIAGGAVAALSVMWVLGNGLPGAAARGSVGQEAASGGGTESQQDPLLSARTKGVADAPITVYEFSDFQCPYCRVFWEETLPFIEREYIRPGKVRLVFINFPLTEIHENAAAAHEFAMCAAQQDRFWAVHDLLYRHQVRWASLEDPAPFFLTQADSIGLAHDTLTLCLESGAVRGLIQAEARMSWEAGVRSTPSFAIEGGLLPGAAPIDVWRPVLDSILASKE